MEAARVLLVDDDADFAETLCDQLKSLSFAVTTAPSGDKALEKLDGEDFDVIVLDLCMPGRDGLETLREIKFRKPLTQVIMLSGMGTEEAVSEGMRNGAFDFLIKPPDMADLVKKMNDAHARRTQHLARILKASGAGRAKGRVMVEDAAPVAHQQAVRAAVDGDLCDGILLVLGRETEFPGVLMEYALEMAERLAYEVMALNAAGLSKDLLRAFPSARESLWQDFRTHSEENAAAFRAAAAEMGVPFSHVVKSSGPDDAIQEVQHEVGAIDFVVSEPVDNLDDSGVGPYVLVYSPA